MDEPVLEHSQTRLDELAARRRDGQICDGKTLLALALIGCAEAVAVC